MAELAWQTFRTSLILEYEIPKYDADLGRPNLFVGCDDAAASWKADHLLSAFPSQVHRSWFSRETFLGAHARQGRGVRCTGRLRRGVHGAEAARLVSVARRPSLFPERPWRA